MPANLSPDPPHPFVGLIHALWHAEPGRGALTPDYAAGVFDALAAAMAAPEPVLGLVRDYLDRLAPGNAAAVTAEARAWLEAYWRETAAEAVH